jgi:hypothetical protein
LFAKRILNAINELRTVRDQQQREMLLMLLSREENKASTSPLDPSKPQGVANAI